MKLYDNNGFLQFRAVRDMGYPFTFVIGGRGTGKTYGALRSSIEDGLPFAFMRRRQAQVDIINNPEFSPVRPVCRDTGMQITNRPIVKGISGFVRYELDEDGKQKIIGEPVGYTCALSTLANVRGFDASRLRLLLYDEFIPEKGERTLSNEADTLFNAYETMNRNRELTGDKPLQLVCMANANDLATPVLVSLKLLSRIDRMLETGSEVWTDDRRGIAVIMLQDSPISRAKNDTALYRLTAGSEYAEMALDNRFAYEERGAIVSRPLAEYRPIVCVGEITVYKHKARGAFYVSTHRAGSPATFDTGDNELARFRRSFGWLWREFMEDNVEFESYLCQVLFTKYIS